MLRSAVCCVLVSHVLLATVDCVNGFASDDARVAVDRVTHVRAMDHVDRTTRSLQAAETATETSDDEREEHEERAPEGIVGIVEREGPVLSKAVEENAEVVAKVESLAKDKGLVDEATINKIKTAVSGDGGFVNVMAEDGRVKSLMADRQNLKIPAKAEGVATSKDPVDGTKADPAIVKSKANGQTSEVPANAAAGATRKYSVSEAKADSPNELESHLAFERAIRNEQLDRIRTLNAEIKELEGPSDLKVFLITQVIVLSIIFGISAIAAAVEQRNEALAEAVVYP